MSGLSTMGQTVFSMAITLNDTIHFTLIIRQGMIDTDNKIISMCDYTIIASFHFDRFDELHYRLIEIRSYTIRFIETILTLHPDQRILTHADFIQRHRMMTEYATLLKNIADNGETLVQEFYKLKANHEDAHANSRYRDILEQDLRRLEMPHRQFVAKIRDLEAILGGNGIQPLPLQWWEQGYDE